MLHSISPNPHVQSESLLLSRADFLVEAHKTSYLVLLLGIDSAPAVSHVHPRIQKLFDEFSDVFPNELSSGLPPLRVIQHHIDLVRGASL